MKLNHKQIFIMFLHFLWTNGTSPADFFHNLEIWDKHCNRKDKFWKVVKVQPQRIIDEAFCWAETPQGHGFWQDLHYQWRHKMSTLENNDDYCEFLPF